MFTKIYFFFLRLLVATSPFCIFICIITAGIGTYLAPVHSTSSFNGEDYYFSLTCSAPQGGLKQHELRVTWQRYSFQVLQNTLMQYLSKSTWKAKKYSPEVFVYCSFCRFSQKYNKGKNHLFSNHLMEVNQKNLLFYEICQILM